MPEIIWVLDGNGHENDDTLKCISSFINAHQNIVFEIGSHEDTRGSTTSNHTLTVARANSIKDALISNFNVQSAQVKTMGYGCSRPFIADSTIRAVKSFQDKEALHSKNRRTELKVLEIK
jgi:outer membrane protein OmpA-like peptidoglycan-associated protein